MSRYIHLNPLRGKSPLVAHPREWRRSSYPGYASGRSRVDWVAYDFVYAAWQGDVDGAAKRLSSGLCQKKQHSPDGGALYLTFSLPSRRSLV